MRPQPSLASTAPASRPRQTALVAPCHPGTRLPGDIVLTRRLASGGTADVYEARLPGERLAVCKVLRTRHANRPDLVRRMIDEGRILERLGSRGLPTLLGRGAHADGRPFLLLERLTGRTAASHLRRFGPLAPARALRWLTSMLETLEALHREGLVHCDLKPSNLFIGSDGCVSLLDLGAAEPVGRVEVPMGTPPYWAPEQRRAGGVVDARTDVHAVGWLALDLLRGGHPGRPIPIAWAPDLARARAVDPRARHPSAAALAAALRSHAAEPV